MTEILIWFGILILSLAIDFVIEGFQYHYHENVVWPSTAIGLEIRTSFLGKVEYKEYRDGQWVWKSMEGKKVKKIRNKEDLFLPARIANWLGMLAWGVSIESVMNRGAQEEPYIRILHPLTWVTTVLLLIAIFLTHGFTGCREFLSDTFGADSPSVWWFAPKSGLE